jgi:predicted Zn-dependent protease with MMP-like domain
VRSNGLGWTASTSTYPPSCSTLDIVSKDFAEVAHPNPCVISDARAGEGARARTDSDGRPSLHQDFVSELALDLIGHAYAFGVGSGLFDSEGRFEKYVQEALDSLPRDLRMQMSNVELVVEEEPPPGQRVLGLYQGVPLTKRGSNYGAVLPDKITIYRGPLERLYGQTPEVLRTQVRRVVLHEVAHHFGITDERLIELDRY